MIKADTLRSERIEVGRLRIRTTIAAEVRHAVIVGKNQDDVWSGRRRGCDAVAQNRSGQQQYNSSEGAKKLRHKRKLGFGGWRRWIKVRRLAADEVK